ncbi:MAG: hypothetical protein K8S62_00115 [Candidatus Sabulitectum sp.]|nr:hypothetical protein [Candidatus Sabulitectum sp.]
MLSDKQCYVLAAPVLLITAVLCFSGTLGAGFVSDDFVLVNRVASEGYYSSWGGESGSVFFRPVTSFSYLCDFHVWGINPIGFHLTNILWHFFAGFAVFLLFKAIMNRSGVQEPCTFSILAGVLFLSLASHSESVAWVSGRTDVIATALCLASTIFYYRQLNKPSTLHAVLAFVLFSVGLLAKESIIITPLLWGLLLVYSLVASKENLRRNYILLGISALIAACYLILRIAFNTELVSNMRSGGFLSLSPVELAENTVRYTFRVLIPSLPVSLRMVVTDSPVLVPLVLLVLMLFLFVFLHKRASDVQKRLLFLLAGCFFVSLLPVLSMKVSLFNTQSERFLYLPGVFAAGFLTVAVVSLFKKSRTILGILVLVILFQGFFLQRSNKNWKQAGRLCSSIAQSVSAYDADSVIILSIPDSYRGAYVFRNGLNEAVTMLTGEESNYIVICMLGPYGDSLYSDRENQIILEYTSQTVLAFVNGKMERMQSN